MHKVKNVAFNLEKFIGENGKPQVKQVYTTTIEEIVPLNTNSSIIAIDTKTVGDIMTIVSVKPPKFDVGTELNIQFQVVPKNDEQTAK